MNNFIYNLIHMTDGELLITYWWLYLIIIIIAIIVSDLYFNKK